MKIETYPLYVQPLLQLFHQVHPLSPEIGKYLAEHIDQVEVKAGDLLQESGKPSLYIYFIIKGAVRGFIKDNKKDISTWISADGELVTSISGIDGHSNALENIQAVENCRMLRVSTAAVQELYTIHPAFNTTVRKILQLYYLDAERRAFVVRLSSAENKYLFFIEHYSHLANRIQLQYIASFLGISMETLSRVRRKISFS